MAEDTLVVKERLCFAELACSLNYVYLLMRP